MHQSIVALIICVSVGITGPNSFASDQPNILWLSCEDISPHLGCYGDQYATTPCVDAFARESIVFDHAYTTAGVCAPCRSAIITGMYQTTHGGHHMRCEAVLPEHIKPFTHWLRDAGYYRTNNSKQDYQFKTPKATWDESSSKAHWSNCPDGKPFFSVFNYTGCHESGIESEKKYQSVTAGIPRHNRDKVAATLPPYYPDTDATRDDWGRYYDIITAMDQWVGQHLKSLDEAGLADDTIVFYWSDHGAGLPRAKRWLYESGTHVPLIVRIPEKWRHMASTELLPGRRSSQLISMIDMGPTVLSLAGIATPSHMQGTAFLGPHRAPDRKYVFGARDRMDERYDIIRMVRDQRFRYIRNYEPYKTWYQYMNTPEKGRTMREIRAAEAAGAKAPVKQFLAPRKPLEELYDVQRDPHELHNLAADPNFQDQLTELRKQHLQWVVDSRDLGLIPEAEIHRLRQKTGSEWAILNTGDSAINRMTQIRDVAVLAGSTDVEDVEELESWLQHSDATVRYWAATGIGNRFDPLTPSTGSVSSEGVSQLKQLLSDESENVRIAAARALAHLGITVPALKSLSDVLDHGTQWARVHAAIVLDELDEVARPAVAAMKRNNRPRKGFVANGKYAVRVLNKALNDLEGTSNIVP